ncbi:MAG: exopolysaccharide biosynthesis polyprenyl glycosylphosphotransferase [Kofleriaceae bacterium]
MLVARDRPLRGIVLVLDAVLVVAAMALAAGLHAGLRDHVAVLREPPRFEQYALVVYLAVPLWLGLVAMLGLHRTFERDWTRLDLALDLTKLHLLGLLGLATLVVLTQARVNRSLVALFLGCSFLLSYAVRSALAMWQRYQHRAGRGQVRVLLVGDDSPTLRAYLAAVAAAPRPPACVGQLGPTPIEVTTHLGDLARLDQLLHDEPLDRVLFFPPLHRVEAPAVAAAVTACETVGVAAELAVELAQPSQAAPRVVDEHGLPFIAFDPRPRSSARLAIKHTLDWLTALVAVVLLAPVFVLVALAILVTMGRPVLFTQPRAGLGGRTFRMIKFRTMVVDAEAQKDALRARNEMTGPVFKVTGDPRVTRLGAFLRKTSLDELPQLFNVLSGSMSLVGPRPLPIAEQQGIRGWHRRRLSMKPGISGLWQVSGRSDVDFEEWMRLDREYVDAWSLGLDLSIALRTIPVVLFRRGAR